MQRPLNIYFVEQGQDTDLAALASADLAIEWDPKSVEKRSTTQVTTGRIFKSRADDAGRVVQIVKALT